MTPDPVDVVECLGPIRALGDRRRIGDDLCDPFPAPGDRHFLAGERLIDKLWQVVLGFGDRVFGHVREIAIQMAIVERRGRLP